MQMIMTAQQPRRSLLPSPALAPLPPTRACHISQTAASDAKPVSKSPKSTSAVSAGGDFDLPELDF